ncbi:hypothetical protein I6I07_19415 [Achromobacter deleyi]|uniref:Uncharacterized protein n=2 Tax=Achromobacter deleyi TaxID=1353891 RepID=A0A7T4AZF7_9BURK|nr:hypothetical protein I6I07_19415 [Achromobacter deleyi]
MSRLGLSGDELLWNWARWCWSGPTVGNMAQFIPEEDEFRPILIDQAVAVDGLHKALTRHEAMIIIAEYPQRHERFAGMEAAARAERARVWISRITGINLTNAQYKQCLGFFKDKVQREVW